MEELSLELDLERSFIAGPVEELVSPVKKNEEGCSGLTNSMTKCSAVGL